MKFGIKNREYNTVYELHLAVYSIKNAAYAKLGTSLNVFANQYKNRNIPTETTVTLFVLYKIHKLKF